MKFVFTIITAVIFTFNSFAQAGIYQESDINSQSKYIEALSLRIMGEYEKAIPILDELIDKAPNKSILYFERSQNYKLIEKTDKAYADITKALRFDKNKLVYYQLKYDLELEMKDFQSLIMTCKSLVNLEPENILNYYDLYNAYRQSGDKEMALKTLDDTKSIFGINEKIANSRINLLRETGNQKEITSTLLELIDAYPQEIKHLHNLAKHYLAESNHSEAKEVFNQILSIDPDDPRANLALLENGEKAPKDLLSELDKIINNESIPIDAKIFELIPHIQEMSTDPNHEENQKLELMMSSLRRIHPVDAKSYSISGDFYFNTGQIKKASEYYKKTLELNNSVYDVWVQIMRSFYMLQAYNDLSKYAEQAVDLYPNKLDAYYFLSLGLLYSGNRIEAQSYISEAKFIASGNSTWKNKFSSVKAHEYFLDKDYSTSVKFLDDFNQDGTWDEIVFKLYGDNLEKLGQSDEALKYWQKAIDLGFNSNKLKQKMNESGS